MHREVVWFIIIIILGETYIAYTDKYYGWQHQARKMLDIDVVIYVNIFPQ